MCAGMFESHSGLFWFQPSLSDPPRRLETRLGESAQQKRSKQRGGSPHSPLPPHNYKAYQLYTLYRGRDGKVMQVGSRSYS